MAQLNLLIHGNPSGWDCWYRKEELGSLSQAELGDLKNFYSSDRSDLQPRFVVDARLDPAGNVIFYCHYLIMGGVAEADGRSSGYVGLTLRIAGEVASDLLQVYDLLERLFEEKAIGILVDKNGEQGYQFRVARLADLEAYFKQWEEGLADYYNGLLRATRAFQRVATPKTHGEQSFALADLLDKTLKTDFWDQLSQGARLVFSSSTTSHQTKLYAKKLEEDNRKLEEDNRKLEEDNRKLKEDNRKLNEQMADKNKTFSGKIEQLKQENEELRAQLQQKTAELEVQNTRINKARDALGTSPTSGCRGRDRGGNPEYTAPSTADPQHHQPRESEERETLLQRFFVPVLLGLLTLLILSQAYLVYSLHTLSAKEPSEYVRQPDASPLEQGAFRSEVPATYMALQRQTEVSVSSDQDLPADPHKPSPSEISEEKADKERTSKK